MSRAGVNPQIIEKFIRNFQKPSRLSLFATSGYLWYFFLKIFKFYQEYGEEKNREGEEMQKKIFQKLKVYLEDFKNLGKGGTKFCFSI